jgi:DNA-binding response OmpR family regulator
MNKKLKLLYAEDKQQTRKDHITYLNSKYDFTIYEANDGIEALSIYKNNMPDIVLTDITMPNMDGLELVKEIRKISHHTKIVILTAHSEHDKLMQALDLHVVNYLLKPINRKKLTHAIEVAVSTISKKERVDDTCIYFNENTKFNMTTNEYIFNNKVIKLSKSENTLLLLLCKHKNQEIDSFNIFISVWNDFDKEYSAYSVRTLVKKLRKKLPDGILENIYGGFYRLRID